MEERFWPEWHFQKSAAQREEGIGEFGNSALRRGLLSHFLDSQSIHHNDRSNTMVLTTIYVTRHGVKSFYGALCTLLTRSIVPWQLDSRPKDRYIPFSCCKSYQCMYAETILIEKKKCSRHFLGLVP